MIRHQAIGGDADPGLGVGLRQNFLKRGVVSGFLKQGESSDTTVQDLIGEVFSRKARAARYGGSSIEIVAIRSRKRLAFSCPPDSFCCSCQQFPMAQALSGQWNLDHHSAHDLVHLEVFLRAPGMCVVAADAGLADGAIGIDGLKIGLIAVFYGVRR